MKTHLVYVDESFSSFYPNNVRFSTLIGQRMKKYNLRTITLTLIFMRNLGCCSQEYERGRYWLRYEMLNEDIESYFEHLRLGQEPNDLAKTYFFWKMTEEELESATKSINYRRMLPFPYHTNGRELPAIEPFEFNRAICYRLTYHIENKPFCSIQ